MTDKERLTNIIHNAQNKYLNLLKFESSILADYLIANGVIVPPCKLGDTVYIPKDDGEISESKVARVDITFMMDTGKNAPFDTWWLNEYNLGITSFLTREEAENALKERGK